MGEVEPFRPDYGGPERLAEALRSFGERSEGHGRVLNVQYVAHGEDWCSLRLPYDPKLVGITQNGVMASGPIIALLDMAGSCAVWLKRGIFAPQATLDLRTDYLRAARPGKDIIGWCKCYHLTSQIGFFRGIAHDGDDTDLIANVTGTFMYTHDE